RHHPHSPPAPERGIFGIGRFLCVCLLALTAVYGVEAFLGVHGPADAFFDSWIYNGLLVVASLACLPRRIAIRAAPLPWLFLGVAHALWTAGDLYYFCAFSASSNPPIPSVADTFYLAFYPVSYVALALLLRRRMQGFRGNLWLDGVIASLAVAALGAAVVFDAVLNSTGGGTLVVATNLAYPPAAGLLPRPVRAAFRWARRRGDAPSGVPAA